ncbi:MAG: polysaccharide deacetylase family protein [Thermotogota bacterium]
MKKIIISFLVLVIGLISFSEVYIFLYHRFDDERYPSTSTSIEEIKDHIRIVREKGFKILDHKNFLDYVNGEKDYDKAVLFTVDDGYKTTEKAHNLFVEEDIPYLLFINTGNVGFPDYLTWEQIKDFDKYENLDLGLHSHEHDNFLYMLEQKGKEKTLEFFEEDLIKSQNIFKEKLGYKSEIYAYPYGYYMFGMDDILKENNFLYAFSQDMGPYTNEYGNFFIPREPLLLDWATEDHLNYILKRKALVTASRYPIEISVEEDFQISLTTNENIRDTKLYISQEGLVETIQEDNKIYSKKSFTSKQLLNRIAIFARDVETGREKVKYWLLRTIGE